ncbi:family 43 glycosylhydrolase [Reichenbachiella carrageenanivorans]|uniref:Family 43 glycosylhydrolase n=1 Tax=Reichenbachiella carrageenanivorans TaxID=2979869 RepID=A0ABY6D0X6_9BACT|nr:family 43 glycosylhydrolase [Reichenbachiella carrageenanivorans]UXX79811.1 family 43 glycosylhydrolase [Reichenbachiella carrageenanivorans]
MKNLQKLFSLFTLILLVSFGSKTNAQKRRSNPFVSHLFTADATARVWEDGRLYVYPSTDVAPSSEWYETMDGYHIFSTDDMITWQDHGEFLHSRDVDWGTEKGGFMWAPDCVYKDGTYYFYFPHKNKEMEWELGLATSKKPASGFELQGIVKGGLTYCDPNIFIDDDGQTYLYAVVDAKCFAAKLKENMMEIEGEMVHQQGVDEHREGPFVFKREGKYYMIYPDHKRPYNEMQYSMSDHPLGPWEPKGSIMTHNSIITMHGSVVEFKGQWYIFYHNGELSGGIETNRSICFDPIYFNEDGTIQMVQKTLGVDLPTFHNDINFNKMFGALPEGEYNEAKLRENGIEPNAVSSIQIPEGYVVECFEQDNFKGKSWQFEEDRIDLIPIGCSDVISSLRISKSNTENLVKNPSFEVSTQKLVKYWRSQTVQCTSQLDPTAKGYYSLQYSGKGSPSEVVQQVEVLPNTDYELNVLVKIDKGTRGQVIFDTKGAFDETCRFELDAKTRAGEWVEFKGTFNSGESSMVPLRCTTSSDFDGVGYWDHVVLKAK